MQYDNNIWKPVLRVSIPTITPSRALSIHPNYSEMSVVTITEYLDPETPLTLKRNIETNYFALSAFIPLLKQLETRTDGETDSKERLQSIDPVRFRQDQAADIDAKEENSLLTKFGILVDSDANGDKWFTFDKGIQILRESGLLGLFKEKLELDDASDNNSTHNNKRSTQNVDNLDVDHNDSQRELGSPLKKLKLDSSMHIDTSPVPTGQGELPFPLFNHDFDNALLQSTLVLQKSRPCDINADNDQKMKLEAFLQRLLFPDEQQQQQNFSHSSIDVLLNDINSSFPHIPLNLNIPVDEHGNTPLHWLTSIANLNLIKELINHGANRLLGDHNGESALVKAVKSVNNYDSGTFEELLDYLYPCLVLEDSLNRTILHHIVITSGMAGCSSAAKYYLDILMGWIVKRNEDINTSSNNNNNSYVDPVLKNLTLSWIITNMLNAQDSNGDTCLNIAARLGNVAIVDSLLDYGADPYVANKSGLRPVDFGAGTSKLPLSNSSVNSNSNNNNNNIGNNDNGKNSNNYNIDNTNQNQGNDNDNNQVDKLFKLDFMKEPDTMSLINDMKSLLANVSKDYENELNEHKEKLASLHTELNSQRNQLSNARERLNKAKNLNDEYSLLKEQVNNIQRGIEEEEANFIKESEKLGISAEETSGIDWDSSEFDADEPFRVEIIYDFLENKLQNEYNGDIEKLLHEESVENVMKQIRSTHSDDEIANSLPAAVLLEARINAYKRNDEHLEEMLNGIREKQNNLEGKFKRVLSLCLKVDEDKVDGMLDGLLQAISSEDPQDIDTDEMQDFLNKHAIA